MKQNSWIPGGTGENVELVTLAEARKSTAIHHGRSPTPTGDPPVHHAAALKNPFFLLLSSHSTRTSNAPRSRSPPCVVQIATRHRQDARGGRKGLLLVRVPCGAGRRRRSRRRWCCFGLLARQELRLSPPVLRAASGWPELLLASISLKRFLLSGVLTLACSLLGEQSSAP